MTNYYLFKMSQSVSMNQEEFTKIRANVKQKCMTVKAFTLERKWKCVIFKIKILSKQAN